MPAQELLVAANGEDSYGAMAAIMERDDYRGFLFCPPLDPLQDGV